MILHVLNASPASAAFRECINVLQAGDTLLLIGDGVYAALEGSPAYEELLTTCAQIHLLVGDALAVGLPVPSGPIMAIDIEGFVTLTELFSRQICWY